MEHRKAEVRQAVACGAAGDEPARFLRELRQLRSGAGLGHAELAARAHFPYDSIMAAEAGPALPDLPVLSAYVRGCGGTTEEWEERWRSLTRCPDLPALPTRAVGQSPAATAGARVGTTTPASDAPDPAILMEALDRVATKMAAASRSSVPRQATSVAATADETTSPGKTAAQATATKDAAATPTATGQAVPSPAATPVTAPVTPAAGTRPGTDATVGHLVTGALFPRSSRIEPWVIPALVICVLTVVLAIFAL